MKLRDDIETGIWTATYAEQLANFRTLTVADRAIVDGVEYGGEDSDG